MNRIFSRVSNYRLVQVLIVLMLVVGLAAASVIAHTIIDTYTRTITDSYDVYDAIWLYDEDTGEYYLVLVYSHTVTYTITITYTTEVDHQHSQLPLLRQLATRLGIA